MVLGGASGDQQIHDESCSHSNILQSGTEICKGWEASGDQQPASLELGSYGPQDQQMEAGS